MTEETKKELKHKKKLKNRRNAWELRYLLKKQRKSYYNDLFIKQEGKCYICGIHQSKLDRKLSMDHNHKERKLRGLLCGPCNTALGLFKDNKDVLLKAVKYLEEFDNAIQKCKGFKILASGIQPQPQDQGTQEEAAREQTGAY